LVFVSDEGGVTQEWTAQVGGDVRRPITTQRVGVEEFVLAPEGDRVAWWSDDTGDGHGAWVSSAIDGVGQEELLTGLGPGWSEGLAWCGEQVAIALSDGADYRIYLGRRGEQGRLVYQSSQPAGLGREWTTSAGGLSADGSLLCLRHSESGDMLHFALRVLRASDGSLVGDVLDEGQTVRVSAWSPKPGDDGVAFVLELEAVVRPAMWQPLSGVRQ
jgi:hypothetical protein